MKKNENSLSKVRGVKISDSLSVVQGHLIDILEYFGNCFILLEQVITLKERKKKKADPNYTFKVICE